MIQISNVDIHSFMVLVKVTKSRKYPYFNPNPTGKGKFTLTFMSLDYLHAAHMGLPSWIRVKLTTKSVTKKLTKNYSSFEFSKKIQKRRKSLFIFFVTDMMISLKERSLKDLFIFSSYFYGM